MKAIHSLIVAGALLGSVVPGNGQSLFFQAFVKVDPSKQIPAPSADSVINCVCPENSGGYVAVWDQSVSGNAVVEHHDEFNALIWRQVIAPTSTNENTRLVLAGTDRVLWGSAFRWLLLDQATGNILRSGEWNYPDLDTRKVILRNDQFYIQQGQQITGYNRDVDCTGTVSSGLEEGRWDVVEGSWLIDRQDRTNHVLRIATLDDSLQAVNVREVSLPCSTGGGYVSHLALGANDETLVVASSIEWTPKTLHIFSQVTRDGVVLWQTRVQGSEHLTGSAILNNGWLLSGIDFAYPQGPQFLRLLDFCGWPQARQHDTTSDSQRWEYVVVNTAPPRLLHTITDNNLEIFDLAVVQSPPWSTFADLWDDFIFGPPFEPNPTPGFWRTRTSPPQ